MSNQWTNVRYFSTFEEADKMRTALKIADTSGTLQVKIKRCGLNGETYVVKSREDAQITAAKELVDSALEEKKTKKVKKSKK